VEHRREIHGSQSRAAAAEVYRIVAELHHRGVSDRSAGARKHARPAVLVSLYHWRNRSSRP
jgi:hypothetical protein